MRLRVAVSGSVVITAVAAVGLLSARPAEPPRVAAGPLWQAGSGLTGDPGARDRLVVMRLDSPAADLHVVESAARPLTLAYDAAALARLPLQRIEGVRAHRAGDSYLIGLRTADGRHAGLLAASQRGLSAGLDLTGDAGAELVMQSGPDGVTVALTSSRAGVRAVRELLTGTAASCRVRRPRWPAAGDVLLLCPNQPPGGVRRSVSLAGLRIRDASRPRRVEDRARRTAQLTFRLASQPIELAQAPESATPRHDQVLGLDHSIVNGPPGPMLVPCATVSGLRALISTLTLTQNEVEEDRDRTLDVDEDQRLRLQPQVEEEAEEDPTITLDLKFLQLGGIPLPNWFIIDHEPSATFRAARIEQAKRQFERRVNGWLTNAETALHTAEARLSNAHVGLAVEQIDAAYDYLSRAYWDGRMPDADNRRIHRAVLGPAATADWYRGCDRTLEHYRGWAGGQLPPRAARPTVHEAVQAFVSRNDTAVEPLPFGRSGDVLAACPLPSARAPEPWCLRPGPPGGDVNGAIAVRLGRTDDWHGEDHLLLLTNRDAGGYRVLDWEPPEPPTQTMHFAETVMPDRWR